MTGWYFAFTYLRFHRCRAEQIGEASQYICICLSFKAFIMDTDGLAMREATAQLLWYWSWPPELFPFLYQTG